MAPKKAPAKKDEKKEEKPKKPELTPEMKELKEKERALEKVSAPDRAAFDAAQGVIQADIDKLQEKLKKLNGQIQEKSQGKEEHFRMKEEIRGKLDEFSAKIDELEKARSALMGNIKDKQQEGRDKRQELNSMKKQMGYDDVGEIDARIREIEWQMHTESLTLKQEKDLMTKIKDLKAKKPLISKYAQLEQNVGPVDVSAMRLSIDEIKVQLTEVREAKQLQQQAYSKLIEARQKVMGDVPTLFQEREGINGEIRALYAKRQEARDSFNAEQREFNKYLSEVRNLRNERYKIERAEKQKEWEAQKGAEKVDEAEVIPFFAELQYLDNMIRHLKGLLPKEEEKEQEQAKIDVSAAPGEVLLAKGQRDEEFFFAPTKKKNLKKKGGSGNAKPKTITHDLGTLAFFDEYKVTAPADVGAIPKCLEELNAKVEEFKVKQAKKIEENKKKAEKKAAGEAEEATEEAAEPAKEE